MTTRRLDRLRWRVAYALNRIPGMCWANLVSWALRYRSLRETRQDWMCRSDTARNGCCYCGKVTGLDADAAPAAGTEGTPA
jgi:hypothetical protein